MNTESQQNASNEQISSVPVFVAPKLKLERAERHIRELTQIRDEYLATEPIELRVEKWDAMRSMAAWTFRVVSEPPIEIALIFGDAIHNIRSALDILAVDAVRNLGKNPKAVHFPFARAETHYSEQVKKSNIKRAGKEVCKFLKELEPYKGGNSGLFALHSLDIVDKHRMILPTVSSSSINLSGLSKSADENTRKKLENWNTGVIDGRHAVIMPLAWSPSVGKKIKAKYILGFHLPEEDTGFEIVDYLNQIKGIVSTLVDAVEKISNGKAEYVLQSTGKFGVIENAVEKSDS